jgi:hypothetical protein
VASITDMPMVASMRSGPPTISNICRRMRCRARWPSSAACWRPRASPP